MTCDRCKELIAFCDRLQARVRELEETLRISETDADMRYQQLADFGKQLERDRAAAQKELAEERERWDEFEAIRGRVNSIEGPAGFPDDQWTIWDDPDAPMTVMGRGKTLREAIDAARAARKEDGA